MRLKRIRDNQLHRFVLTFGSPTSLNLAPSILLNATESDRSATEAHCVLVNDLWRKHRSITAVSETRSVPNSPDDAGSMYCRLQIRKLFITIKSMEGGK